MGLPGAWCRRPFRSTRALYALLALWVLATLAVLYAVAYAVLSPQVRVPPASAPAPAAAPALLRYSPPPPKNRHAEVESVPWAWFRKVKTNFGESFRGEEEEVWVLDAEPLTDPSSPSQEQLFAELQEKVPSLAINFWTIYNKAYKNNKPRNCTKLSNLFELEYNNLYWQLLKTSNGTFQLFGAYLDVRLADNPVVRVLGMINRLKPIQTYCQLWFQNKLEPIVTKVTEYRFIWISDWGNDKDGLYQPYLFACPVPKDQIEDPPSAVSIVENPCDKGTNILRVIYNKPEKEKDFAVCVKGLDYYTTDLSVRLIEWIELLGLLGADKIFFYKLNIHPNISKVLEYYEKKDKVQVVPITLPAAEPNLPILQHYFLSKKIIHKRQNEVIPYNDCLYKNLYSYRYITLLDIDEVIMPVNASSWIDLVKEVEERAMNTKKKLQSFYAVRNVYFLDDALHQHPYFKDIPKYMHMLQHVYRSKNFTKPGAYIKGFHDPKSVVTLHNHFPRSCLGNCFIFNMETTDAQLQHYRSDCVRDLKKSCVEYRTNSIIDTKIWRYKEDLIRRTLKTLKRLEFLKPKGKGS